MPEAQNYVPKSIQNKNKNRNYFILKVHRPDPFLQILRRIYEMYEQNVEILFVFQDF